MIHQQTQIENGFISFLKCINDKILNINIKTHVYISKGQGQAFLIGNTQVMTYSIVFFLHFYDYRNKTDFAESGKLFILSFARQIKE